MKVEIFAARNRREIDLRIGGERLVLKGNGGSVGRKSGIAGKRI